MRFSLFFLLLATAEGFVLSRRRHAVMMRLEAQSRRSMLAETAAAATVVFGSSLPALAGAPVGEGGLPDGARQFSNILLQQREWNKIGKRVRDGGSSVSKDEWKNIQAMRTSQLFLS